MPNPLNVRSLRQAWRRREVLDMYAMPVSPRRPEADSARQLREATAEVLTQMRTDYPQDLNERKYQLLLARLDDPADRTLIIHDEDGTPCGYCHITTGDTVNARIRFRVRLRPHQAYFWDDHLFMAHRRKGLHSFSIARRLQLVAQDGITEVLTIISRPNVASQQSFARFGVVRRRVLIYVPRWGRTIALPTFPRSRMR
ncbi:MAG: hypothetical protein L0H31_12195 [Nocardioidaceae bacterium]|nr:hypothetical protein [Nocardioidaceae bacterium]